MPYPYDPARDKQVYRRSHSPQYPSHYESRPRHDRTRDEYQPSPLHNVTDAEVTNATSALDNLSMTRTTSFDVRQPDLSRPLYDSSGRLLPADQSTYMSDSLRLARQPNPDPYYGTSRPPPPARSAEEFYEVPATDSRHQQAYSGHAQSSQTPMNYFDEQGARLGFYDVGSSRSSQHQPQPERQVSQPSLQSKPSYDEKVWYIMEQRGGLSHHSDKLNQRQKGKLNLLRIRKLERENQGGKWSSTARAAWSKARIFVSNSVVDGTLSVNDFEKGEREDIGAWTPEELAAQRLDRFRGIGERHRRRFDAEWDELHEKLQLDYEEHLLDNVNPPLSSHEREILRRRRR